MKNHFKHRLAELVGNPELRTLSQFVRPNLRSIADPWRRILEPLLAALAGLSLVWLASLGLASLLIFALAGALIYAILTHVFGVRIDMRGPW